MQTNVDLGDSNSGQLLSGLFFSGRAEISPVPHSKPMILAHPLATLESATKFMGIYDLPKTRPSLFYALNRTTRPKLAQLARPLQKKRGRPRSLRDACPVDP